MVEAARVLTEISTWESPRFFTLTLDATAYPDPLEIYAWLKDKRVVARWLRELRRRGFFRAFRWCYYEEFQQATEQVHFHGIADTVAWFDYGVAHGLWNREVPAFRRPTEGGNPLGACRWEQIERAAGVAKYVTKYVSKGGGLPNWYLDNWCGDVREVRLVHHSRGLFPRTGPVEDEEGGKARRGPYTRRRARERIEQCKQQVELFKLTSVIERVCDEEGPRWVEKECKRQYLGRSIYTLEAVKAELSELAASQIGTRGAGPIDLVGLVRIGGGKSLLTLLKLCDINVISEILECWTEPTEIERSFLTQVLLEWCDEQESKRGKADDIHDRG